MAPCFFEKLSVLNARDSHVHCARYTAAWRQPLNVYTVPEYFAPQRKSLGRFDGIIIRENAIFTMLAPSRHEYSPGLDTC